MSPLPGPDLLNGPHLLNSKVVVVTGGGRGIGRATALACAREGATVLVSDPGVGLDGAGGDPAPAAMVVAEILALGGQAAADHSSLVEPGGAEAVIGAAIEHFDRIDAVINTAGILRDAIWHKLTRAQWDAVIDVHLNGAFAICQAAAPHFRAQRSGAFVLFTSGAGLVGNVAQANYAAAKMGVVGLTQSLALDLARSGVRANCVAPVAWSRMIASTLPAGSQSELAATMGADRVGALAAFLASDAAEGVTNQIFGVHGDTVEVWSKPRPVRAMHRAGGWSAAALAEELVPRLGSAFAAPDETALDVLARPVPERGPPGD